MIIIKDKTCSLCQQTKVLARFPTNCLLPDNKDIICKACFRIYADKPQLLISTPPEHLPLLYCVDCGICKPPNNFISHRNHELGFTQHCKSCFSINRAANRDYHNQILVKAKLSRWEWYRHLKSQPCTDCGRQFHTCCMDFDHLPERGKKLDGICAMIRRGDDRKKILAEIAKCDLVCIMCHQTRTNQRTIAKFGIAQEHDIKKYLWRNIQIYEVFRSQPCYLCHQLFPTYMMEADHIDPSTKEYTVSHILCKKESVVVAELAKCQPICSMCHRLETFIHRRFGVYNTEKTIIREPGIQPTDFYLHHSKEIINKIFSFIPQLLATHV